MGKLRLRGVKPLLSWEEGELRFPSCPGPQGISGVERERERERAEMLGVTITNRRPLPS